jgi:hypothetical protein
VNFASLSRFATCHTRSSACDTRMPALSPERVLLSVFPLVSPLSSTTSAAPALFGGFAGTTGLSDFPPISGLRPQPSPSGPPLIRERADGGISRFSRTKVRCMLRFFDSAEPTDGSRLAPPAVLPSDLVHSVGTPEP